MQQARKTSGTFFVTVVPQMQGTSCNQSVNDLVSGEPFTALTKNTRFTSQNSSIVQQSRHLSQGPMRSEKVYLMT